MIDITQKMIDITQKMIDLKSFCSKIEHAPNNGVESAECDAIKFDGENGFAESLTENCANQCRVDYFDIIENGLIMIEMKDLQSKILKNPKEQPTQKNLKAIFKNMSAKFANSFDLIKQEISPDLIEVSNYLVWKDNTDTNLMDRYLPANFKEKPYQICKTKEICEKISKLDTRICQE
ncbi:hypothetical protein [Bathymodiolus septemdierum thioautotrophic gill symbiont]|uniref:Uncharacterized protein n=1 Tax=endosymbiont of Bathymodiolus septemdierum str. Myojin knoll TaxID=1303921 RepID=A0A0P0UTL7_9GAMM|nr:hypothetical protein [Bathymodiolus septemdierum thioautotrophic gill symbiont]BAS68489.1 hypothetical protein BSEPE_1511 [endosymbiont of Bathymodiolus septemdierum str. Myojin knoll]